MHFVLTHTTHLHERPHAYILNVSFVARMPAQTMEARILGRGKTSGRVDDNRAAIQKRFRTYARGRVAFSLNKLIDDPTSNHRY